MESKSTRELLELIRQRDEALEAKAGAEAAMAEANDKADIITSAIKERCDAIIADFKRQMVKEKEDMWHIRTSILDFKKDVFELYRKHIEELQAINVNELEDIVLPNENTIVEGILSDVSEAVKNDLAEQKKIEDSEDINLGAVSGTDTEPQAEEVAETKEAVSADLSSHFEDLSDADEDDEDLFIKSLEETD